jgi:tRNA-splicing ligase RtcB
VNNTAAAQDTAVLNKGKGSFDVLEVSGKYNSAKIFTDVVDQPSIAQVITLCSQEFARGSRIRMMPDIHAGKGCTVGTTMTISGKVTPSLVGVDIGCGMETVRLREKHLQLQQLDKLIYQKIPSGFAIREKPHRYLGEIDLSALFCRHAIDLPRAEKSLGTLGGGNHFIEVDRDEEGALYLVIHSGSRRLGLEVANYYQDEAYQRLNGNSKADREALAARLKAEGREKEIQKALKALKNTKRTPVPYLLAYAEGELFDQYIHDMGIVQQFAALSRRAMADEILRGLKLHEAESFTTIHNYIDTEAMILRKGAVSAKAGERLLIPINMRDGSLICTGKGNEDWNFSAPHGAGRLMSRSEAKQSFTVSQFKKEMDGVYTTSVGKSTLDECPMAYKSMEDILGNIGETVEVEQVIRPIYNFKAGAEED